MRSFTSASFGLALAVCGLALFSAPASAIVKTQRGRSGSPISAPAAGTDSCGSAGASKPCMKELAKA